MSLAARKTVSPALENDVARAADGRRRRILYAEDQVSSRVVTKAMLEKMGFIVEAVDDGEVAVEMARKGDFDMVLLDIEMPVMDGVTAARTIRSELSAYRDKPILALSAFLADSTEQTDWRDAFDTAVPKPANCDDLKRAMVRAMAVHGSSTAPRTETPGAQAPSPWHNMREALPMGARVLLVQTAAHEMQHLVLALAVAAETRETEQMRKCRHTLKGLALNFGASDIATALTAAREKPEGLDIQGLFARIKAWQEEAAGDTAA